MNNQNDILIEVEGLSKKFCKDLKTSLWYGVKDLAANVLRKEQSKQLREKEFWAVKDVSFTLRRGECLGLIGHNGAGKSTLLKILNGLINPDEGKVIIKGKVGALIELGAGFNPILSGRENIYNNGAILGFTKAEIDAKVEEIIDFSEIREFIDMPVQNYSSGMKVRLGFAVAAQMEPDILIIDEVLAVGDVSFRAKCFNVLEKLIKKSAVIIVSHSMPQIARICSDLIILKKGQILLKQKGDLGPAIEAYYELVGSIEESQIGNGNAFIKEIKINGFNSKTIDLKYNDPFEIEVFINVAGSIKELSVRLTFFDVEQKPVAQISSQNDNVKIFGRKDLNVNIMINELVLNIGTYSLHVAVHEINNLGREGEVLHIIRSAVSINVRGNSYYSHAPCLIKGNWNF